MKQLPTILIISILIISGCSNNEATDDLKQENEQLKQEAKKLLGEKEELELDLKIVNAETARKKDLLNNEISSLEAGDKEQKEVISRYLKAFDMINTHTNAITDILSIFSREEVKEGSQIAGLTVSNVATEPINDSTSYFVKFTGEFEVRGSIVLNVFGGSQYSFIVKENLERIPHTIEQLEKGSIYFDIEDSEELMNVLGDKLEGLSENDQLEIVAVFKSYSYNYVPETDILPSSAEFVRLKSEN